MRRAAPAIILAALAALAAQADLPYDAEIEYLESTGTQWIDTGKTLSSTGFDYDANIMFKSTANCEVFGGRTQANASKYDSLSLFVVSGAWRFDYFGDWKAGSAVEANTRYSVSLANGKTTVNGVELSTPIADGRHSGATVYIFAGHRPSNDDVEYPASIRLYSLKFYQGGELTADYQPVRIGTTGYLYDRANPTGGPNGNGLYGNAGTGAFVVGPDVRVVAKWPRPPAAALLLSSPVDPSRMVNRPTSFAEGGSEGPCLFTAGGESEFTICYWLRWHCVVESDMGGLGVFPSISTAPARATAEGGAELPDFLSVNCPLDASGDWSSSVSLPAGTETVDGRVVICANITTDSATTLSVGGATVSLPASPSMQIRNLDVAVADVSAPLSVVVHADPGGQVELALGVNPWVEFKDFGFLPGTEGLSWRGGSVSNQWALYSARGSLSQGGQLRAVFAIRQADGFTVASTNTLATAWTDGVFPKDIRIRGNWVQFFANRGRTNRLDRYGIKAWPKFLTDAELGRVFERDLQELARRGEYDGGGQ